MAWTVSRQRCSQLLRESTQLKCPPAFLIPAFSLPQRGSAHQFSTSASRQSRIGALPISVPPEVSLRIYDLPKIASPVRTKVDIPLSAVEVTGPLGQMTLKIPSFSILNYDEALKKATIEVKNAGEKHQRAMWGTIRQHLQNYILGVSEGHTRILRMVGVGFRASVEPTALTLKPTYPGQQFLSLKVGFAHPVELGIPEGVKASTPQPTMILLEGINKEVVTEFAANIREWRKPEPYKGKGIFIGDETIKLKAKKIK